jgi:hypothetical protein
LHQKGTTTRVNYWTIINNGAANDLTNQIKLNTTNLASFISLLTIAMAILIILPFPIAACPSTNNTAVTMSLPAAYAQSTHNNNNNITTTAHIGDPFQLRINHTAIILPNNMSMRFIDVPEDSRCPAFVACVWQGQVTVSLNFTESSFHSTSSILNFTLGPLPLNSSAKDIYGHTIQLQQVEPYPIREQKIAKSDYTITLIALQ